MKSNGNKSAENTSLLWSWGEDELINWLCSHGIV